MTAASGYCDQCGRRESPLRRLLCHACYERRRTAGLITPLVDPKPVAAHITHLQRMGLGLRSISATAGVDRSAVQKIVTGRRRSINARTAAAILAIPIPEQPVCLEWTGASRQRRLDSINARTSRYQVRMVIDIKCGDCEHRPCICPRVDDADVALLGSRLA